MYFLIPLIIGLVLLGIFLYFRANEKRVIAVYIKAFVSLMFILTALLAWLNSNNPTSSFGLFIILGLGFGLIGDITLDIKFIDLKRSDLYTKIGFTSFGIGHIFYLLGLLINFYDFSLNLLYLIIPTISALALMAITLLMEKFTPIRYKNMKLYVIIYAFILFFDVAIFLSTMIQKGFSVMTIDIIAFSLISFALSDLILNNTYFAPNCNTPVYIISNHIFYYIAQFLIAVSLFFLF